VDLRARVRQLEVVERLEKSVEGPASESREGAHTVLIAEAEVAGAPMDLEGTQTDRELAHQVQSRMEQVAVPFVDVRIDQEEGSVLEWAHEAAERHIG